MNWGQFCLHVFLFMNISSMWYEKNVVADEKELQLQFIRYVQMSWDYC